MAEQLSQQDVAARPGPEQPRRERRVGTLTMGVCLIAVGAALCWGIARPGTDFTPLVKLAPAALILLGAEVLFAHFAARGARIRYDVGSVFLCFVLICGSLAAACAVPFLAYYGPGRERAQSVLSSRWSEALYAGLGSNAEVKDVDASVYLGTWRASDEMPALTQLADGDYARANIRLTGPYADKAAFLAACESVLEAVRSTQVSAPQLTLYTQEDGADPAYTLSVSGKYLLNRPAAQLESEVQMRTYNAAAGRYMDEKELARWKSDRAQEAARSAASGSGQSGGARAAA